MTCQDAAELHFWHAVEAQGPGAGQVYYVVIVGDSGCTAFDSLDDALRSYRAGVDAWMRTGGKVPAPLRVYRAVAPWPMTWAEAGDAAAAGVDVDVREVPLRASIWREDMGDEFYQAHPWATWIPPEWNSAEAYAVPGDPESSHVGIYGLTYWKTFDDALLAVEQARDEIR